MHTQIVLTNREKEILMQLVEGYTNKIIADNMNISVHTVKSYLEQLYYKTDSHSKVELLIKCIKAGLLDLR